MSEALALALRMNLAAAVAVGLVLLLRAPARRVFGAGVAYGLWTLVPLAVAAMLAPARIVTLAIPSLGADAPRVAPPPVASSLARAATQVDIATIAAGLWLAGLAVCLARLTWRQAQFGRAVRDGLAGPAVVGVLRPRIVTPHDFACRYTPLEQELVLAHEATHLARQDSRINALVALARCPAWFNPLVHVFAHCLRIDQELACDAQVVARRPAARRAYAEAMLKTQLAVRPLPLGCYWPANGRHPLARRIAVLGQPAPGRAARTLGGTFIAVLAAACAWTAWAARPTEIVWVASPAPSPAIALKAPRPEAAHNRTNRPAAAPQAPKALPTPAMPSPLALPVEPVADPSAPAAAGQPPEGCGLPERGERRLLAPGDFGPSRRVQSAAGWSSVVPGTAVRVYAATTDPDGVPLVTDLTAFGSQSWYRVGCIKRSPSHYKLFTSVAQRGERLLVTALLNGPEGERLGVGQVELASGQAGTIALPGGQQVQVVAAARPETTAEIEGAERTQARGRFVNVLRVPFDT